MRLWSERVNRGGDVFCSVVLPAISLASCWNEATTVSMSCRFYTLIPGKHKHFSKSLCWLGRRTEIAFHRNEKDFFMESSKSFLEEGQTLLSEKRCFQHGRWKGMLSFLPWDPGPQSRPLLVPDARSGKILAAAPTSLRVLNPHPGHRGPMLFLP